MIKTDFSLHNKFDIIVEDVITGNKKRIVTHNVILDNFFNNFNLSGGLLTGIAIGRGNGVPSNTDSGLFSRIGQVYATVKELVYEYPTSRKVLQIKLETTDYNGETITEVGVCYGSMNPGTVYTHAILKDNEGSPISITKTDTMVVYIEATIYCTITNSGLGTESLYTQPTELYHIVHRIFEPIAYDGYLFIVAGLDRELPSASDLVKYYNSTVTIAYEVYNKSYANGILTLTWSTIVVNSGTANNLLIRYIGHRQMGAIKFPDSSIMPNYAVTDLVIGTGDGNNKDFNLKSPLIVENSETIKVNGITMVKDVDYTIEYFNNYLDSYNLYSSARLKVDSAQVTFGNYASKAKSSLDSWDPLLMAVTQAINKYPANSDITTAQPIILDFQNPVKCNRYKVLATISEVLRSNMRIQYSSDGINYTNVTNLTEISTRVWSFDSVTARYWKIFSDNQTWTMWFTYYSIEGNNFGSQIFLGYTTPGLKFTNAPAQDATITASYELDRPFKTSNNIMRFGFGITMTRG